MRIPVDIDCFASFDRLVIPKITVAAIIDKIAVSRVLAPPVLTTGGLVTTGGDTELVLDATTITELDELDDTGGFELDEELIDELDTILLDDELTEDEELDTTLLLDELDETGGFELDELDTTLLDEELDGGIELDELDDTGGFELLDDELIEDEELDTTLLLDELDETGGFELDELDTTLLDEELDGGIELDELDETGGFELLDDELEEHGKLLDTLLLDELDTWQIGISG